MNLAIYKLRIMVLTSAGGGVDGAACGATVATGLWSSLS